MTYLNKYSDGQACHTPDVLLVMLIFGVRETWGLSSCPCSPVPETPGAIPTVERTLSGAPLTRQAAFRLDGVR